MPVTVASGLPLRPMYTKSEEILLCAFGTSSCTTVSKPRALASRHAATRSSSVCATITFCPNEPAKCWPSTGFSRYGGRSSSERSVSSESAETVGGTGTPARSASSGSRALLRSRCVTSGSAGSGTSKSSLTVSQWRSSSSTWSSRSGSSTGRVPSSDARSSSSTDSSPYACRTRRR